MKKVQNLNLSNTDLNVRGKTYRADAEGVFDMDDEHADVVIGTPGFKEPKKRTPRVLTVEPVPEAKPAPIKPPAPKSAAKAATAPQKPPEPPKAPEPPVEPPKAEKGAEEPSEDTKEDDVPPYAEWEYQDLVVEVNERMNLNEKFIAPESKKKDHIIAALEADDALTPAR